jgi:hypothetical protein
MITLNDKLNSLKDALPFELRNYLIQMLQASRYNAYNAGFKAGLECFAHWKDGEQFVGTIGTTLKTAIQDMKSLYNYTPDQVDLLIDDRREAVTTVTDHKYIDGKCHESDAKPW